MMSQEDKKNTDAAEAEGNGSPAESLDSLDSIEIPEEVAELIERIQAERDEAIDARTRALADFQNFQRRSSENESRAREQGIAHVIRSLIPVLDQFDLALGQEAVESSADSLVKGLELVKAELHKAIAQVGVEPINPVIGGEFDPNLHEAMLQQPGEDVEPGNISMVIQSGWVLGSQVIRPAKVAIAPEGE